MRVYTLSVPAGQQIEFAAAGDYVRVRSTLVTLTIEQPDAGENIEVSQGDDFQFSQFQRLRVSHNDAADQTIKLIISKGKKAGSAQVGGSVSLDAVTLAALESISVQNFPASQGAFTSAGATVANASGQLLAANANRRYLEIQNNGAAGAIFVNVAGVAATVSNGRKIQPGESWVLRGYVPAAAVFAIGDAASNANVVVIEG